MSIGRSLLLLDHHIVLRADRTSLKQALLFLFSHEWLQNARQSSPLPPQLLLLLLSLLVTATCGVAGDQAKIELLGRGGRRLLSLPWLWLFLTILFLLLL